MSIVKAQDSFALAVMKGQGIIQAVRLLRCHRDLLDLKLHPKRAVDGIHNTIQR
jgi:hypothetical protein